MTDFKQENISTEDVFWVMWNTLSLKFKTQTTILKNENTQHTNSFRKGDGKKGCE